MTDQATDHPEQDCRVQGEIFSLTHADADGETLDLEINIHPADNLFFALVDAMRRCKGLPKVPFLKKIFGPSTDEEEGQDAHASGYGLSCDAFANKGAVLLDGTVVQEVPKGHEAYADPMVNPVGADTVIPFHQSNARVILYGGTTRSGFAFDGNLTGEHLDSHQAGSFAYEVWRWDINQSFPKKEMLNPVEDDRLIRKEFEDKCYFDPIGAVRQFLKQRDLFIERMKKFRIAEAQDAHFKRTGIAQRPV